MPEPQPKPSASGNLISAGEQQRNGECQHIDEHGGYNGERRREPECMGEGVIHKNHLVVAQPRELDVFEQSFPLLITTITNL